MTAMRLADVDDDYSLHLEEKIASRQGTASAIELQTTQKKLQALQESEKRKGVYGSVYDKETWQDLSKDMESRNIPSYDVIVCRPAGPFSVSHLVNERENPDNRNLTNRELLKYAVLFDQLFSELMDRVNRNHGILLLSIPDIFSNKDEWISRWVKKNKEKYGAQISIGGYFEHICVKCGE